MEDPLDFDVDFDLYWADLRQLGSQYGENIADQDGWREPFERGLSAEEAFFEEFPEHKPS